MNKQTLQNTLMKKNIRFLAETDTCCHSGVIVRTDIHNLYLKAENVLALFTSLLRLFQIRAPLNSNLFCREDVLNRGIRRSLLELHCTLL